MDNRSRFHGKGTVATKREKCGELFQCWTFVGPVLLQLLNHGPSWLKYVDRQTDAHTHCSALASTLTAGLLSKACFPVLRPSSSLGVWPGNGLGGDRLDTDPPESSCSIGQRVAAPSTGRNTGRAVLGYRSSCLQKNCNQPTLKTMVQCWEELDHGKQQDRDLMQGSSWHG